MRAGAATISASARTAKRFGWNMRLILNDSEYVSRDPQTHATERYGRGCLALSARHALCCYRRRGGTDAFYHRGDLACVVAPRAGQWLHARQLHLRAARHRARPVRGRVGERAPNGLAEHSPKALPGE